MYSRQVDDHDDDDDDDGKLSSADVPEYRYTIFQICIVFSAAGFARAFPEKRLKLKSLKRQMKAEEEGLWQNGGTEGSPRGEGPALKRNGAFYFNLYGRSIVAISLDFKELY